jgi:hypothetical protein
MIRTQAGVCYQPRILYKPQFAYPDPPGYRAESFVLPFQFNVLANGNPQLDLPWKLDDDVPWVFRGMTFAQVFPGAEGGILVRVRDTYGNQLSQGLVLSFGAQGMSGFNGINAFGFPFDCEVFCEAGGTILFDFQVGYSAQAGLSPAGGFQITVVATLIGPIGTGYSLQFVNPGAPNVALSISVVGTAVTVTLATNGASAITSTLGQVVALINGTPAAAALMTASTAVPANVATAVGQTFLILSSPPPTIVIQGTMLGVKLFKDC